MGHDFHYGFYHKSPYQIVIYSKDLDPERFELDIHGCNHADQMSQIHAYVQGQLGRLSPQKGSSYKGGYHYVHGNGDHKRIVTEIKNAIASMDQGYEAEENYTQTSTSDIFVYCNLNP